MSILSSNQPNFQMIGGNLSLDFANHMLKLKQFTAEQDRLTYVSSWLNQAGLVTTNESRQLFQNSEEKSLLVQHFLQEVIRLQAAVYHIFWAISQEKLADQKQLAFFNEKIKEVYAQLIIREVEKGFAWEWADEERSLADYLRPIVRSAAELLTSGHLSRIRLCPGEDCGWLFLDTTKNRSRKWCDMRDCGNVVKVRNYRKRQRKKKGSDDSA